jgi:hypothetical protein
MVVVNDSSAVLRGTALRRWQGLGPARLLTCLRAIGDDCRPYRRGRANSSRSKIVVARVVMPGRQEEFASSRVKR